MNLLSLYRCEDEENILNSTFRASPCIVLEDDTAMIEVLILIIREIFPKNFVKFVSTLDEFELVLKNTSYKFDFALVDPGLHDKLGYSERLDIAKKVRNLLSPNAISKCAPFIPSFTNMFR